MTPEQAAAETARLSKIGRMQLEKLKRVSDKRIRKIYRRAAGRIASTIQLQDQPVERLVSIQNDLVKHIDRLSRRISKETTRTIGKAVNTSIKAVENAVGVYSELLPGQFTTGTGAATFNRIHNTAMRALVTSPQDGIKLSTRIWDQHQVTLRRMRRIIADGYLEGFTDYQVQQFVKSTLILPNVDMRTTKWREFFKRYPPGRGVYRSAHKNTMRVIRTEVNEAYRRATVEYADRKQWVRGVKWNLAVGHPEIDICDDLASSDPYGLGTGVYTPDAVPITPHPQCICYLTIEPKTELLI